MLLKSIITFKIGSTANRGTLHRSTLTMHVVCVASLRIGVDSVVESMVSSYEHRFNEQRNLLDENATDEMDICVNEP